ncbi:MAG: hypothetical protein Q8L85_07820 [Alphaproteobacteria bacterium]|nr:hypothetical protein [Alphaproteobacteria bacterium]
MLKTITKCCAIIFLFSASNESFSTNLYTKMMPTQKSVQKLEQFLEPVLDEVNKQLNGKLIYNSSDWHMTLKSIEAPDYIGIKELRDWSTYEAQRYITKNLSKKLENITNRISGIHFKINGVTIFGKDRSENKFIVLTLEPDLSHIADKGTKTRIRNSILEKNPHISLARFKHKISYARHDMNIILNKTLDIIESNNIEISFNKTIAEATKDTPIWAHSVAEPIEIAAY